MPVPMVHDALRQAVADNVFPGAVLIVDVQGHTRCVEAVGNAAVLPDVEPADRDTVFDLASLTKPLITAALTLSFVAEQRLAISEPVATFFPEWGDGEKARATIRHLLTHTSGLPEWRPLYRAVPSELIATSAGGRCIVAEAAREPLLATPGTRTAYSDIGFILLGAILEQLGGAPLHQLASDRLLGPLGLSSVGFLPIGAENPAWLSGRRIAATEQCPWRKRVLRGQVHDDNAYAMGGVAGHAGLFGDAAGVLALVNAWQDAAAGSSNSMWPADLTTTFLRRQEDVGDGSWSLGWMVPTPPSSSGRFFSARSYGHLGFTGTSVWVDPDRGLTVVLLTNRVHPTRDNRGIMAFRPQIHDIIYRSLFPDSSARYDSASRT